jgi:hypothetical protein
VVPLCGFECLSTHSAAAFFMLTRWCIAHHFEDVPVLVKKS